MTNNETNQYRITANDLKSLDINAEDAFLMWIDPEVLELYRKATGFPVQRILNAIKSLRPRVVVFQMGDGQSVKTTDPEAVRQTIRFMEDRGKPTDWDAKVALLDKNIEFFDKWKTKRKLITQFKEWLTGEIINDQTQ